MDKEFKIKAIPVIHIENLSIKEKQTATQILKGFDEVKMPFVTIENTDVKNELKVVSHNVRDLLELSKIANEVKSISKYKDFRIVAEM